MYLLIVVRTLGTDPAESPNRVDQPVLVDPVILKKAIKERRDKLRETPKSVLRPSETTFSLLITDESMNQHMLTF
ncbi:hypothetical protein MRB53_000540 [Persea americana]|uniref:Uncharacterized protein n=1 Tax=Persea americana TaxID=3435 RepID=A0ACC2MP49_PERAE|nr:hypothetical protein MRB53_000540 [Persea americana]